MTMRSPINHEEGYEVCTAAKGTVLWTCQCCQLLAELHGQSGGNMWLLRKKVSGQTNLRPNSGQIFPERAENSFAAFTFPYKGLINQFFYWFARWYFFVILLIKLFQETPFNKGSYSFFQRPNFMANFKRNKTNALVSICQLIHGANSLVLKM